MYLFSATESSIIQIAARDIKTSDHYVRFIMPENGFVPPAVSKLTGIEVHGLTMYFNLVPVEFTSRERAAACCAQCKVRCAHPSFDHVQT